MRIILVRHAEAHCNILEDEAIIDSYDPDCELTEEGMMQAAKLRDEYPVSLGPAVIYSSCCKRALQTATIFRERFPVPLVEDNRLNELYAPSKFSSPITQREWDIWLEERIRFPEKEIVEGLESLDHQSKRIADFYTDMLKRHEQESAETNLVIFTHAFCIQLSLLHFMGLSSHYLQKCQFKSSNTAMHIVQYDSRSKQFVIESMNNRLHLQKI
ncbi:histidine phosphatase family protein [Paenibacillus sp. MZ04-78.2]|uniref:histidine phosphatase family protein n=1 Tax=Paenibacillus sp. MZ04-78.2 TaxID=2962034 RepID=UPI0020B88B6A|nr:histidine phosphatase family protein [Paenibacillus sp. MZ04-78.2]MCP3774487.1 histidine phosphatase family protein [Paenibacillus sp. MZ04-78.2]